jgi:hypothetical protein
MNVTYFPKSNASKIAFKEEDEPYELDIDSLPEPNVNDVRYDLDDFLSTDNTTQKQTKKQQVKNQQVKTQQVKNQQVKTQQVKTQQQVKTPPSGKTSPKVLTFEVYEPEYFRKIVSPKLSRSKSMPIQKNINN